MDLNVSSASTATTTSPASRLPASTAAGSVSTDGFCNDHAHSPLHTALHRAAGRSQVDGTERRAIGRNVRSCAGGIVEQQHQYGRH